MVKYGESQANSSSRLETRGLWWHDSVNDWRFKVKQVKTPGHWREDNPVPEAFAILMKIWRPLDYFWLKMKNSGLKFGSREICLPQSSEALNIRFEIPVQKESISRKFEFSGKIKRLPKRICCHDARFKHGHPALLVYLIGHMWASALYNKVIITLWSGL